MKGTKYHINDVRLNEEEMDFILNYPAKASATVQEIIASMISDQIAREEGIMKRYGLMGVSDNGMLFLPNGKPLCCLPLRVAFFIQRVQHWIAVKTWR